MPSRSQTKPIELDVQYVFIYKDARALSHLTKDLHDREHGAEINRSLHLIRDEFAAASPAVRTHGGARGLGIPS